MNPRLRQILGAEGFFILETKSAELFLLCVLCTLCAPNSVPPACPDPVGVLNLSSYFPSLAGYSVRSADKSASMTG